MKAIKVGTWRDDDTGLMQIVSGPIGRERVHFEVPPERFAREPLNERQILVLNRVLDGFEGKLTTSKWAKLAA